MMQACIPKSSMVAVANSVNVIKPKNMKGRVEKIEEELLLACG